MRFALLLPACSIQQSAALALGRLANYSDDLAEAVVQNEILPQLVSGPGWHTTQRCATGAEMHRAKTKTGCTVQPCCCGCTPHGLLSCAGDMRMADAVPYSLCAEPVLCFVLLQVYSLAQQNRFYKKAAGYCLRAVAK